jgi:hypothetical protein
MLPIMMYHVSKVGMIFVHLTKHLIDTPYKSADLDAATIITSKEPLYTVKDSTSNFLRLPDLPAKVATTKISELEESYPTLLSTGFPLSSLLLRLVVCVKCV